MIELCKYNLTKDESVFLEDIIYNIVDFQTSVTLSFENNYSFQIDPCGNGFEVWHLGKIVNKFENIDDLLLNLKFDGKPFIEQLSKIDYE